MTASRAYSSNMAERNVFKQKQNNLYFITRKRYDLTNKAVINYALFANKIVCLQSHSNVESLNQQNNEQKITQNNTTPQT
jgi:hypothetical protein